jgi:hypothetical protein
MNVGTRLAAFGALLTLVFAAAAFAGSRVDPRPGDSKPAGDAMGMGGMEDAAAPVRGLAVSDDGLTLALDRTHAPRGRSFPLRFAITGLDGAIVRDFDVAHTKRMHLIVVRRDMTGFQHLHPIQRPDGSWSTDVTLPDAGAYRVFADFAAGGKAHTLASDLTVDGAVRNARLPAPAATADVGGMRVALSEGASRAGEESELAFAVTRNGRPVAVQPYLGARGHLVALREGDLAFLHVHPDTDRLRFGATFPTAGRYRLFLQFQVDGRVHTAAFTQAVGR